jgi:hypothetical protein
MLILGSGGVIHASDTDFTDVTSGAMSVTSSTAASWGDFNGDGCVDIFIGSADNDNASSLLFKNDCDGTFTNVTGSAGLTKPVGAYGAAWGDFDDDGDLDLYIAARGREDGSDAENVLYRNNGNETFTEIGGSANVDDPRGSAGVAWGDYDNDGDLDLFVANRWNTGASGGREDRLYRNNGNNTFTDVAPSLGIEDNNSNSGGTFQGIWADFNEDGFLDLYVSVDFSDDVFYENDGLGGFDDVSGVAGIAAPQHGMGIGVGDPNLDGCLDVSTTNNTQRDDAAHAPTFVYLGDCNSNFTKNQAGILDRDAVEWGINFVDFDNDMDEDLSIVAGGLLTGGEPNVLYENDGTGNFTDVTVETGTENSGASYGSAWADFDDDGDLDWFVANWRGDSVLFRNDGPVGNYLAVELEGVTNNYFGIGARVTLVAGGVSQIRQIQAGESYLSNEEPIGFFGLGTEVHATQIRVDWPGGGVDQVFDISGNQTVRIKEGVGVIGDACLLLNVAHTGMGSDPVAAPANSVDCPAGTYHPGEAITLSGAVPAGGWNVGGWSGSDDDGSVAESNALTMPGTGHTVTVHYVDPSLEETVTVTDDTLTAPTLLQACSSITLGSELEIAAGTGEVLIQAPMVIFVAPVSVTTGAVLTVDNSEPEGCPL